VFVFSTVFHEFSHAFVARRFGDTTAERHGLATLNPVPHIQRTPMGMVIVPLLSFIGTQFFWMIGWASVPYDPYWAQRYPKQAALMGLAGPAANLILVLVASVLMYIGLMAGAFIPPEQVPPELMSITVVDSAQLGFVKALAVLLSIMYTLNILLKYRQLMAHPTVRMFGIFIAWYAIKYVFWPVYSAALFVLYGLYYATSR
jgi:hypothetical protein